MPYYRAPIIGTGTDDDPYRPDLPADLNAAWSAEIPCDKNGHPAQTHCIIFVAADADALGKLAASPKIENRADALIPASLRATLTAKPAQK
jgi:hypothetical protein